MWIYRPIIRSNSGLLVNDVMSKAGDLLKHYVFGHVAPLEFMGGLKSEIDSRLRTDTDELLASIKREAREIESRNASTVVDAPSHGHLELCSTVLSAYSNLKPFFSTQEETCAFISDAMMKGINNFSMRAALKMMLEACKDNPDRLKEIFSWLMEQYGATFAWSAPHRESESEDSFSIEVTDCYYFNFFSSHDAAFLTPILCQLDSLWFDMVDPEKHGFMFDKSRYRTQGYGAPTCVFPIVKKK